MITRDPAPPGNLGRAVEAIELALDGDLDAGGRLYGQVRHLDRLEYDIPGSVNERLLVAVARVLYEPDLGEPEIERAARHMLGEHDPDGPPRNRGWGASHREGLSTVYPVAIPALSAVYQRIRDRSARRWVARWLRVEAALYAVAALRHGSDIRVWAPGQRSHPWTTSRDRILRDVLEPGTLFPLWGWSDYPGRLMARAAAFHRHRWAGRRFRRILVEHVDGADHGRLIGQLERDLVDGLPALRAPMTVVRHEDGVWAYMDRNTSVKTPPAMLVSSIGGAAAAHPSGWRQGEGKAMGRPTIELDAGRARVVWEGAVMTKGARPTTISSPWVALPSGPVLWSARV